MVGLPDLKVRKKVTELEPPGVRWLHPAHLKERAVQEEKLLRFERYNANTKRHGLQSDEYVVDPRLAHERIRNVQFLLSNLRFSLFTSLLIRDRCRNIRIYRSSYLPTGRSLATPLWYGFPLSTLAASCL